MSVSVDTVLVLAHRSVGAKSTQLRESCGNEHAEVRLRVRPQECGRTAGKTLVVGFGDGRRLSGEFCWTKAQVVVVSL